MSENICPTLPFGDFLNDTSSNEPKLLCHVCEKGKLNRLNRRVLGSCVDFPSDFKKLDHCEYHAELNGTAKCTLCENGYSFYLPNPKNLTDPTKCMKECIKGCLYCSQSKPQCAVCNDLRGYFMTSPASCSYRGFPEGFGNGLEASSSSDKTSKTFGTVLNLCLTGLISLSLLFWQ